MRTERMWMLLPGPALAFIALVGCRGASRPDSEQRPTGVLGAPDAGTRGAAALGPPPADERELARELDYKVASPFDRDFTGTLKTFAAKKGVEIPVELIWVRYEKFLRVPAANFKQVGAGVPSPTHTGWLETLYQQTHLGYPVAGYGYWVASANGMFRSARGKAMPGLPDALPVPIGLDAAREIALKALEIKGATPWLGEPAKFAPPRATLLLTPRIPIPKAKDFVLVWSFDLRDTGIGKYKTIDVDAQTSAIVRKNLGWIPN